MKRPAEAVTDGQGNGEDGIHPSRKRRIEYTETDAKLASLYSNLSDEVKSVRLHAAAELVRILKTSDASVYDRALTRLIRGLCSSRKASRSGFFVALTEVFRLQPNVQADLSLAAIVSKTESLTLPDHKSSGQVRYGPSNVSNTSDKIIGKARSSPGTLCRIQSLDTEQDPFPTKSTQGRLGDLP